MAQEPKNLFHILTVDDQGRLVAKPDAVEALGLRPGSHFLATIIDDRIVLQPVQMLTPEEAANDPDWDDWDEWEEGEDGDPPPAR